MTEAQEENGYIELEHELRPETARRLQADYDRVFGQKEGDLAYGIGNRNYERRGGKWFELKRRRNPPYWDQPRYFVIFPGPHPHAFIVVKQPRRLLGRLFQKAVRQIFTDATGIPFNRRDAFGGVDGTEKEVFDRRVNGEKPEPAYEIFLDGTWKRLQ